MALFFFFLHIRLICFDSLLHRAFCGRSPVGLSGTVSPNSWAGFSRDALYAIYVGSLVVIGFWLLLALSLGGFPHWLAGWESHPPPHLAQCCIGAAFAGRCSWSLSCSSFQKLAESQPLISHDRLISTERIWDLLMSSLGPVSMGRSPAGGRGQGPCPDNTQECRQAELTFFSLCSNRTWQKT